MNKFHQVHPYILLIGLFGTVISLSLFKDVTKNEDKIPYVYLALTGLFAFMLVIGLLGMGTYND